MDYIQPEYRVRWIWGKCETCGKRTFQFVSHKVRKSVLSLIGLIRIFNDLPQPHETCIYYTRWIAQHHVCHDEFCVRECCRKKLPWTSLMTLPCSGQIS
ncbi:MAG: hypothetical protein UV48_C0005G0011 [Candidatus Azambacteria bacterium GW2011_GWA2_42_9]|uniref:Uncharacterized protein n=3 Tax=Candidatus Azamiibacteriota TaxID=1752741 RepID=A0A0G1C8L2_9BACT|nr:MAG: hypothetical protein UV07_C0016G0008 [Candidatus Azambacteria bacterium GW2011_GWB1_42_17]KKS45968.1 MAG: hypothetical protein UV10_C0010G0008 [Candidatus Azambacteria bacterium GW2011_GWA1_42_19]KKS75885.1 MAG: hypothetical protein UV48_C0005G0011 [Candidatus Azambacteria bacterium GW2011_GWA2_42_9]